MEDTLTIFVPLGTSDDVYPKSKLALEMPVSNADVYPFTSENKSNGPVSEPAVVRVINIVVILFDFIIHM